MIGKVKSSFTVAIALVMAVTVIICVAAISCSHGKLTFKATYYFVCYRIADNSVSASSLSGTVSSYGGAGYIINRDGNYYVTVSCYYTQNDADAICTSLRKRDLDCTVLEAETPDYKFKNSAAKRNADLYLGNLNTLNSLSSLAYECANGLDTGSFSQNRAKEVVLAIKSGLNGLLKTNADNCFTEDLLSLVAECADKETGFLYSKDMRYLQIAITDVILNVQLY